jgi:hypothetical protein
MNKQKISFKANKFEKGRVNFEDRIIHDVVLIEPNREASGHGIYVDQTMVNQVVSLGQESGDVGHKAKFDHPSMCFSSMGSQLGRLKNFRLNDENKAIADLHVGKFTKDAPGGDMGKWLLGVADEDPDQVGFSIVFSSAESKNYEPGEGDDANDPKFLYPHARIDSFYGADVVDEGAATSSLFQKETMLNNPEIITEKIEKYFDSNPDLLGELMPLLTKLQDKYTNTNTNQSIMSDNTESLGILDKIKALMKGEEAPEAPAVIETGHAEALAAKDAEILALTEKAEADKTANELALSSQSEEFNTQLGDLKTQVEALGSESIGTTIDTVSTEDSSVELSEEENKNNSKRTAEEDIAFYASEETAGRTATVTYKNNK